MSRGDFWSRRRAAVEAEEAAEARRSEAEALAQDQARQEDKTDEELLAEFGLPDPDSLQEGDDIAGFMAKAVPERLRRRALRQLWRVNPAFNHIDELIDYGGDFTDAATVVENLQTAYQVGKGMLRHIEALAEQEAARAANADQEPSETESEAPSDTELSDSVSEQNDQEKISQNQNAAPASTTLVAGDLQEAPGVQSGDDLAPPRPRRMRFSFEKGDT